MKINRLLTIFLVLVLPACVEPVHYSSRDESFLKERSGRQWRIVVVLQFSGDPAYARPTSEWFTHLINKHALFETIGPAVAGIELEKKGLKLGEGDVPIETAQQAGRMLGADGVIVGAVKTSSDGRMEVLQGKKVVGASIVDVGTGKVVATSARSAVLGLQNNMSTVAAKAAGQVADDLLPALYALAGRTWTPPPPEPATPKQGEMPWVH